MNLITFQQAKEIDQKTIQKNVPELLLMGLASQSALISMFSLNLIHKDNIYIFLCGSGNNGGDGLALAYLLSGTHLISSNKIHIYLKDTPKSDASKFYQQCLKNNHIGIKPLEVFLEDPDTKITKNLLYSHILIIEALLGTGQKDIPRKPYLEVLNTIQKWKHLYGSRVILISLDIPCGLSESYSLSIQESQYKQFFQLPIPNYIFNFGLKN